MQMLLVSFNAAITCNASECLSWIIILFNILTVFYLAFCAWFKVTKAVKLFGWIWSALNVCVTIIIIFFHACIFTLISAVFTGLITMATLSVVFNHDTAKNEASVTENNKIKGYYVIFGTTDGMFAFRLYDVSKKYYMTSRHKFASIEQVKKVIAMCRKNGLDIMLEDRTSNWIKSVDIPKFVLMEEGNRYYGKYVMTERLTVLKTENYKDIVDCTKCVRKIMDAVLTDEIYIAKEKLEAGLFLLAQRKPAVQPRKPEPKVREAVCVTEVKKEEPKVIESVSTTEEQEGITTKTTLTDSFRIAKSIEVKVDINKRFIADYLEKKYGNSVEVNRRENYTKPSKGREVGLPLADTHYTIVNGVKKCFTYVYEVEGTVLILVKAPTEYIKRLTKTHKYITRSLFPKSKETWYSIAIDDSWTENEVCCLFDDVKAFNDKAIRNGLSR